MTVEGFHPGGAGAAEAPRRAAMLIIVSDDGRLLLHHRDDKPGILHPGCWAGFGGAVEPGETAEEAVRREVMEETGLDVRQPTFLCEAVDAQGRGDVVTLFYAAGSFRPEDITLTEGQEVGLVPPGQLSELPLAPFVRRAIETHLLPRLAHLGSN